MDEGLIEVTGVPMDTLVRFAYDSSLPQGLGVFHYQEGSLTDEEVGKIVERGVSDRMLAISMDYVKGRSCKFRVLRRGDKLFINNKWHDHSTAQLKGLLRSMGLSPDLVEIARQEESDYYDHCVAKAMKMIVDNGGKLETTIDGEKDEDVYLGLYLAKDRKLVEEKYEWPLSIWTEAKKAA